jgi:hypothetical protein
MAAALGFHRGYFGWFSHPPHANFDSLSSGPVFGVHHTATVSRDPAEKENPTQMYHRPHRGVVLGSVVFFKPS